MQVVTSNIDRLHERTGILPYRTMGKNGQNVLEDLKAGGLAEAEGIITVGLGRDTRRILGTFKKMHPHAPIISIDLRRPLYIGPDDYFIKGDLQIIFAEMVKYF